MFKFFFGQTTKANSWEVCNVQCLRPAIYKKIVEKNHKICNKHVKFALHPKNLDGIFKPLGEELTKLGFNIVNTVLADIIKAMENAPSNSLGKKYINQILEEAMTRDTALMLPDKPPNKKNDNFHFHGYAQQRRFIK